MPISRAGVEFPPSARYRGRTIGIRLGGDLPQMLDA